MRRLATLVWLAASTCAAAPVGGDVHTSPHTLGEPVRLTIRSPADFAAATSAMSALAWGDAKAGARLEVVVAAGDYAGQSLQLKQDPSAPNAVALVVRGEGRARVASLALDLEAAQVEVADLVFEGPLGSYALKVRTPGPATLRGLVFLEQVVGAKGGPARGGVLLLEASSATATASIGDCAFVGGVARQPVPMVTLGAQPASMFERVSFDRALLADAEFPTLISAASARQVVITDSVVVLRPGTTLVRAEAPWVQLSLQGVTVVTSDPADVLTRGGVAAAFDASGCRMGWPGAVTATPAGVGALSLDRAALDGAVVGLRDALRAAPFDRPAFEAAIAVH
jgi:hypothetical protein